MSMKTYFIYLFLMAFTTYIIRAVPFALVNKKITNRFFKSFLAYVPYTVLAAMTVPAIFTATGSAIASIVAFVVAVIMAYANKGLMKVAFGACFVAFAVQAALMYFA